MVVKPTIPIVSFVGYSGSGKTTLLTKVIKEFKNKGLRVATIKHDAHKFEIDHEGKDTWKYANSGSDIVVINSREKLAMITKLNEPISFDKIIASISDVDIIFVEGYKHEYPPKILLARREKDIDLLAELNGVIAIATTLTVDNADIPIYHIDDYLGIVQLIQSFILGE